jgi:hypothetical protein
MKTQAYDILEQIRQGFQNHNRLIPVSARLKLTKTQRADCEILLLNDVELHSDVLSWIGTRGSLTHILRRYQERTDVTLKMPNHFPARVASGLGSISSGQNIFLFFPECLEVPGRRPDDYFGVELIDVWANIFQRTVFPCTRTTFTASSQIEILSTAGANLDKTIFLASIFHELGHQVGSWRVSPTRDARLLASAFFTDVFGEMATDSMLVSHLPEFPEITAFVLLQRLFWFGRRGFRDNPQSALINSDNDSWLSTLLWQRLRRSGALLKEGSRYQVRLEAVRETFIELSFDIERLGAEMLQLPSSELQDQAALAWMKREVPWRKNAGFLLPTELQEVYRTCVHIEEIPFFHPLAEAGSWNFAGERECKI